MSTGKLNEFFDKSNGIPLFAALLANTGYISSQICGAFHLIKQNCSISVFTQICKTFSKTQIKIKVLTATLCKGEYFTQHANHHIFSSFSMTLSRVLFNKSFINYMWSWWFSALNLLCRRLILMLFEWLFSISFFLLIFHFHTYLSTETYANQTLRKVLLVN